jgi:hypothetical protein
LSNITNEKPRNTNFVFNKKRSFANFFLWLFFLLWRAERKSKMKGMHERLVEKVIKQHIRGERDYVEWVGDRVERHALFERPAVHVHCNQWRSQPKTA